MSSKVIQRNIVRLEHKYVCLTLTTLRLELVEHCRLLIFCSLDDLLAEVWARLAMSILSSATFLLKELILMARLLELMQSSIEVVNNLLRSIDWSLIALSAAQLLGCEKSSPLSLTAPFMLIISKSLASNFTPFWLSKIRALANFSCKDAFWTVIASKAEVIFDSSLAIRVWACSLAWVITSSSKLFQNFP